MKLLTASQIREADNYTIKNEPIPSVDLMERAVSQCTKWLIDRFNNKNDFAIFTGPGNNGGDGLAIARQLSAYGFLANVFQLKISDKLSADSQINLERLIKQKNAGIYTIEKIKSIPDFNKNTIIIDAIFGSGLSRTVDGLVKSVIQNINKSNQIKVAIDIPSGLFSENNSTNDPESIIKADYTLTFQVPKQSFFIRKNRKYTGEWIVLDIGLNKEFINSCHSDLELITNKTVRSILKDRPKFAHKGNFGHALLFAGRYGKMGAAVLSSKSCLRTGCGLLTTHVPKQGVNIMQTALPEAMVSIDASDNLITEMPGLEPFTAIGIGPGIGTDNLTAKCIKKLLRSTKTSLVIDADGINILSQNKDLLKRLPENTILTPHPKEFERMAGKVPDDHDIYKFLADFTRKYNCYLVYKEAFTKIICPNGKIYINSTGNPGMATAGSGDVLTGMILSFLAQNYSPEHAAISAVYTHGLAGDLYTCINAEESLIAGDIIKNMGAAFKKIKKYE